jgi:hypothetical protein
VRSLRAGDFFWPKGGCIVANRTYATDREIKEVVGKFEGCKFALEEFTHARHLTVACWYLCTLPPEVALSRMRDGLRRFITHHERQGYHETITRFWMELLRHALLRMPPDTQVMDKINNVLEMYTNKDVLFVYYSRDRVLSEAARADWIEPDLREVAVK